MITKIKYAVIAIEAPESYLTDNGEEPAEVGWEIIEIHLARYLTDFNRFEDPKVPNAKFVEWEEEEE